MLTGAAEEGGAWYPAWPHNLPSTQQTEMQSRSPGNSVKLKQSWRRQHQQHPHSPHRKPPQRGAHPHRLCPLPHNPSSTHRTTSSCLSPRSSPQSPGRLAQQCCKRVIQQIAHQYFWHRTLSECPRCTAPTPACTEVCGDEELSAWSGQPQAGLGCSPGMGSSARPEQHPPPPNHLCPPPELPPGTHLRSHGPEHAGVIASTARPRAGCKGTHHMWADG